MSLDFYIFAMATITVNISKYLKKTVDISYMKQFLVINQIMFLISKKKSKYVRSDMYVEIGTGR